jgi:hypothetical protein
MADDKKPKPKADPMKDLKWLVGFLLILGLMWFMSDGPEKSKNEKPFIQPNTVVR